MRDPRCRDQKVQRFVALVPTDEPAPSLPYGESIDPARARPVAAISHCLVNSPPDRPPRQPTRVPCQQWMLYRQIISSCFAKCRRSARQRMRIHLGLSEIGSDVRTCRETTQMYLVAVEAEILPSPLLFPPRPLRQTPEPCAVLQVRMFSWLGIYFSMPGITTCDPG